jgi:hypothetical protein
MITSMQILYGITNMFNKHDSKILAQKSASIKWPNPYQLFKQNFLIEGIVAKHGEILAKLWQF